MADLQTEIDEFFKDYSSRWNSQKYSSLEELWDTSDELPFYRAMEVENVIAGWKDLRRYWSPGVSLIDGLWNQYVDLRPKLVTPDVAVVLFQLDWDIKVKYARHASSGSDPGMAVLKKTPEGWRMVAYIESCMSPSVYVRKLFERQARPSFLEFLKELGVDKHNDERRKGRPNFWD